MRKVFALFMGLILLSMFAACSKDDTPTPPVPHPSDLEITTAAVAAGYTCSPYNVNIAASGGTAPYSWAMADGSEALPSGVTLSAEGRLTGVVSDVGNYTFTVRVTDSAPEPEWVEKTFTMNVNEPASPSLAIFFDGDATVCSTGTASWTPLACYVYIMLNENDLNCAQATEFKLRLTDIEGVDLEAGTQYGIINVSYPAHVNLSLGDLFNGVALSFSRPMFGPGPVHVASFSLLLFENLENLSFKFEANPGGYLAVASCETGFPIVQVNGREAAVNY